MKSARFSSRVSSFLLIILIGSFIFSARPAQAQFGVGIVNDIWAGIRDGVSFVWQKSGSTLYQNVFGTAVKQIAYDYATYLGSGGEGQKPLFSTEDLQTRMINAGNSALGQILEQLANPLDSNGDRITMQSHSNGKTINSGINLCRPDLSILKSITLGIADVQRPTYNEGLCDYKELVDSWQGEYDAQIKAISDPGYLGKLGGYFNPGASDLSVAFTLMGFTEEEKTKAENKTELESSESGGWIDVRSLISKKKISPPGDTKAQSESTRSLLELNFGKTTGDIVVDAANIFINRLALTAFNKLMSSIGKTSNSGSSGGLSNPYLQGDANNTLTIENKVRTSLQVQFSDRTDYDILGELTSCPNPNNPGPTNCVISSSFSNAISEKVTLIKAIEKGYLNGDYAFGFKGLNNEEPLYNQGYPYRSLVILRKYRVIPVGWELAAQFIQRNNQSPVSPRVNTEDISLMDLVNCFDSCDEYQGYNDGRINPDGSCTNNTNVSEKWCAGLVDPNWVLKIPKLYCKAEGYGPEIQHSSYDNQGKFCSEETSKACIGNIGVAGCDDTNSCCDSSAGEGSCETKTALNITRNENYCADEQSCIKESANGSCAYYGYCTEEKRRWIFNQNANNECEAINNTCQTFSGNGKTVSYLENTLDYSDCSINDVGCQQYAINGTYTIGSATVPEKMAWSVNASGSDAMYFNKNITDCDSNQEGCHQFIRVKDNLDTNLIADGSFERSTCVTNVSPEALLPSDKVNPLVKKAQAQTGTTTCDLTTFINNGTTRGGALPPDNRWFIDVPTVGQSLQAGIVNDKSSSGGQSLYVKGGGTGQGGLYTNKISYDLLPDGFQYEDDRFYTLSADIYVVNKGSATTDKVKVALGSAEAFTTATDNWQTVVVTYYRAPGDPATDFYIQGFGTSTEFYVDDLKLTVGEFTGGYSDYLSNNVIYQKLLPAYLEASCYRGPTDYRFKDEAQLPAKCKNYARKCNADEVGCETYTSLNTGIGVTAKIKPKDVCPASCVGYDAFVAQPTYFSAAKADYFIPNRANTCSSQAVGCTAFTNLDKLEAGGEAIEYYSYLRTCIKPDVASCSEFYTWEGSDDSGYQLRVFSLKKNGAEPASTLSPAQELLVCNEDIFKKLPSEAGYNYDCRQFYDRSGTISYHLYTRTISCSEDCHPYRREVANQAECIAGNGTWDGTRCIYYAISSEGTTCSAPEVGCREYAGNIANNIRIVNNEIDGFETTTDPTNGWNGGSVSNTALNLGGKSFKSMPSTDPANFYKFVGKYDTTLNPATFGVRQGESYTISFLAKAQNAGAVNISGISLTNSDNDSSAFLITDANVGTDWKIYTFNLDKLDHEVTPNGNSGGTSGFSSGEKLAINFSGPVYIDNIKLVEVPDRYYLIKDSWTIPEECDQTVTGAAAPRYMLGCSQYSDSNNKTINLHSFSQLCQDSAAGCEQMIDTKNSYSYKAESYSMVDAVVAADEIINVAYDKTKQCGQENKGCQRFGLASTYNKKANFTDVYKNNDPDKYNTIICKASAVGCSEWSDSTGGKNYFKDPGEVVCEWRAKNNTENDFAWLRKKVKTCGGLADTNLCSSDSDCASGVTCQFIGDIACPISETKTIGTGGVKVNQPTVDPNTNVYWAGICRAEQAGCTEYIDPVSRFNSNIIYNPDYQMIDNVPHAGWVGTNNNEQAINRSKIKKNTVYILKGAGAYVSVLNNGSGLQLYQLNPGNNQFVAVTGTSSTPVPADNPDNSSNSTEFFIVGTADIDGFKVHRLVSNPIKTIELREAIVSYQFKQSVDKSPTFVDFKSGRVLFNERSVKASLVYNADKTAIDKSTVMPPQGGGNLNANVILQVAPDRVCDKWLACKSYDIDPTTKKQTCFDVGLCNQLAPNGECANFVENVETKNKTFSTGATLSEFSNLSGYSKAGYDGNLVKADMYQLAAMKQVGQVANLNNGSFEKGLASWSAGTVIKDPKSAKEKEVVTANNLLPDGQAFLELNSTTPTSTTTINLSPDTTYAISGYIYNRNGSGIIRVMENSENIMTPISTSGKKTNEWLRVVGVFKTKPKTATNNYDITLVATGGEVYFDDIRIETVLNNRCDDNTDTCANDKKNYLGSACRLYPKANSLACSYDEEDTTISQKGWRGYCLEWDPKNSQSCLLWYPLDRIASDGLEESGAGLNLGNWGFCTQANDRCDQENGLNARPKIYCSSFSQAENTKYWRTRLQDSSTYVLPTINSTMTVSLGRGGAGIENDKDGLTIVTVNDLKRNNSYGVDTSSLSGEKVVTYNSSGLSFFPFYSNIQYSSASNLCYDNRRFSQPQVDTSPPCQGSATDMHFGSRCYGRTNGGCDGHLMNESCKRAEIYGANTTRYDTCNKMNVGISAGDWGATEELNSQGVGSGKFTYEAFADYPVVSPEGKCGFYTRQFDKAAIDNAQAKEFVKRLFVKGTYSTWSSSGWSNGGGWDAVNDPIPLRMPRCSNDKRPFYDTSTKKCIASDGRCNNDNTRFCSVASDCLNGAACNGATSGDCLTGTHLTNKYNDYCYVQPQVFNLKASRPGGDEVSGKCSNGDNCSRDADCPGGTRGGACATRELRINSGEFVTLKFNSKIDPDQLPLAEYEINWDGNGFVSVPVSVTIYDRPNPNNTHQIAKSLSYDDFNNASLGTICGPNQGGACPGIGEKCCVLKPKIKITDNWGFWDEINENPITIVILK